MRVTFCIAQKVTMLRPANAHPSATAQHPKSSDQKNSLFHLRHPLASWFACMLIRIPPSYFLYLSLPERDLLSNKIVLRSAQTVLGHGFHYRK